MAYIGSTWNGISVPLNIQNSRNRVDVNVWKLQQGKKLAAAANPKLAASSNKTALAVPARQQVALGNAKEAITTKQGGQTFTQMVDAFKANPTQAGWDAINNTLGPIVFGPGQSPSSTTESIKQKEQAAAWRAANGLPATGAIPGQAIAADIARQNGFIRPQSFIEKAFKTAAITSPLWMPGASLLAGNALGSGATAAAAPAPTSLAGLQASAAGANLGSGAGVGSAFSPAVAGAAGGTGMTAAEQAIAAGKAGTFGNYGASSTGAVDAGTGVADSFYNSVVKPIVGGVSSLSGSNLLDAGLRVGGAIYGSNAAKSAAQTQSNSANAALQQTMDMYNQNRADLAPWVDTGANYLSQLNTQMPDLTRSFTTADFTADPGYQFRLSEGQKAIDNKLAALGLSQSGPAVKEAARFNQGLADQTYQGAYNRFNQDQANTFNRLNTLSNTGVNAAGRTANLGANAATNAGNFTTQAGNARAAGSVGSANSYIDALNNYNNQQAQLNALDLFRRA